MEKELCCRGKMKFREVSLTALTSRWSRPAELRMWLRSRSNVSIFWMYLYWMLQKLQELGTWWNRMAFVVWWYECDLSTWYTASSAGSCSGCSADTSWPPWSRTSWWTPQMLHCANISRGSAKLYVRMLRQGAQMDVSLWEKMCILDSPPAQTLLSHII